MLCEFTSKSSALLFFVSSFTSVRAELLPKRG